MKDNLLKQRRPEEHYQSISFAKSPSIHRRVKSNAFPSGLTSSEAGSPVAADPPRAQHTRSLSLPDRKASYDSDSDSEEDVSLVQHSTPVDQPPLTPDTSVPSSKPLPDFERSVPQLPPLIVTPLNIGDRRSSPASASAAPSSGGGGWWDVVSAVAKEDSNNSPAPWDATSEKRSSERMSRVSRLSTGSRRDSLAVSVNDPARNTMAPLPPGAEPALALDFTRPMMNLDLNSPVSQAKPPFSAPVSPHREAQYLSDQTIRPVGITGLFGSSSPPYGYAQQEDEDGKLPPPPPLRFDQSRGGHTLGSSTTPSAHSSPFTAESTPTSAAFNHSALSSGLSYPVPPNASSPAAASPAPHPAGPLAPSPITTKSKLGSFGRSMSLVRRKSKKEKEKDGEKEGKDKNKKERVLNDPGKWNRDLVVNIMGPPAR